MPILLCLNKTGPLESNFINKIITKNTGDKITIPSIEITKSKIRLILG